MRITSVIALLLVTAQVNAATVIVMSTPKGAEIFIGETSMGKTPCRLQLPEGKLTIVLKHKECEDLEYDTEIGKKLLILRLKLPPKKYPVDLLFKDLSQMGWVVFTRSAEYLGAMPGTVKLPKGQYTLLAVKDGFSDVKLTITVTDKETQLFEAEDPKKGKSSIRRIKYLKYVGKWKYFDGTANLTSDFKYELHRYNPHEIRWTVPWKFVWPDTIYVSTQKGLVVLKEDKDGDLVGAVGTRKWTLKRTDK